MEMVGDVMQPTPPAGTTEEMVVETPAEAEPSTPEPTPTPDPVPPSPEPVVAPLPAGTVVFVEPRQVVSPAVGEQLKVNLNIKGAADVLAYEVTVGFDPHGPPVCRFSECGLPAHRCV